MFSFLCVNNEEWNFWVTEFKVYLIYKKLPDLFPKWSNHFTIPPMMYESSTCPISPIFVVCNPSPTPPRRPFSFGSAGLRRCSFVFAGNLTILPSVGSPSLSYGCVCDCRASPNHSPVRDSPHTSQETDSFILKRKCRNNWPPCLC